MEECESMAEKIAGMGNTYGAGGSLERTVILPDMLRRMMKQEELKELEWAVENEGVQLKIVWTGEEQRNAQTP
jgi:hypothetical protein